MVSAMIARRILRSGVLVTLAGAILTLIVSAIFGVANPVAKAGAVLTMIGLAVAFLVTPIAFVLTTTSIVYRLRYWLGRGHEHK